jgi:DNA-binding NarL/FixJ family response regulator
MTPRLGRALNILIADDHAIVREGLKRLLESAGRDWKVAEAGSGFQALELLRREAFDIAVFDLSMPGMDGLELLARARTLCPQMPVVILTMRAEEHYALRAFEAGARAYITKDTASKELADAVDKVAAGGVYVSATLADRMVLRINAGGVRSPLDTLSARELEVLRRLVDGQRPSEIAQALHLSIKTVSTHKSHIQEKLQLPTTAALVRYGLEHGLGADDAKPSQP